MHKNISVLEAFEYCNGIQYKQKNVLKRLSQFKLNAQNICLALFAKIKIKIFRNDLSKKSHTSGLLLNVKETNGNIMI